MATGKICDRCWTPIVEGQDVHTVDFDFDGYKVEAAELCSECFGYVLRLAKRMKLGPDKVPGGVRKGRKK